jgi:hypothetical protein
LNIGAIVGGAVAGVAVIAVAALAFFYLRQRRGSPQAVSAASVINSASQPRMGEVRQPMSDSGSFTPSSMPASFSTTTRLYVRVLYLLFTLECAYVPIFCAPRIRIAQPHFLSTTKEFHQCPRSLLTRILLSTKECHLCPRSMPMRILLSTKERHFLCPRPLPKYASHRMMGAEISCPTCGPRCHSSHRDTTVYPWSDFSLRVSPDDRKYRTLALSFLLFLP